jgi:hypothetical protein
MAHQLELLTSLAFDGVKCFEAGECTGGQH